MDDIGDSGFKSQNNLNQEDNTLHCTLEGNRLSPPPPLVPALEYEQNRNETAKAYSRAFPGNVLALLVKVKIILTIYDAVLKIMTNKSVWAVSRVIFGVASEIFVYIVLGVCSIIIALITQVDEINTKRVSQENDNVISKYDDYVGDGTILIEPHPGKYGTKRFRKEIDSF